MAEISLLESVSTLYDGVRDLYEDAGAVIRPFQLVRNVDVSGSSGTGVVAEGFQVVLEDTPRFCMLRWLPSTASGVVSVVLYDSIDDLVKVHGHGGSTLVQWGF